MLNVAAYTGGRDVPSARFRVRQYINKLISEEIRLTEYPAWLGTYPPQNKLLRPAWGVSSLVSRFPAVLQSYQADVTLLQREMLSTYLTLESLTKEPRVLDVDDAIWLHSDGRFAKKLAHQCTGVICGNNFLAEQFSQWNSGVTIIPTAVDTERFIPSATDTTTDGTKEIVIGWSGTSSGLHYLYKIEAALLSVLNKIAGARLRIVSNTPPSFKNIPKNRIEFIPWSGQTEVASIQGMSVGIMPLEDSLWARGKCSYKMLTYMACAIPVLVSPIGMNAEILSCGECGYGPITISEWSNFLVDLSEQVHQRRELGNRGREIVMKKYSLNCITPQLAQALKKYSD